MFFSRAHSGFTNSPVQWHTPAHNDLNTTHCKNRENQAPYTLLCWDKRRLVILPLSRWNDYTAATKITGKDEVLQLLECCDEQLRKDLTRNAGGSLANKPLQEVMQAIKTLAIRDENAMVGRVQLHNMRQDHDETIRSFCARARGQAGVCKFTINCPNCHTVVNYTDNVLCDVLTRGLADSELQLDLLADKKQDKGQEEIV